jgi:hypothetical protein
MGTVRGEAAMARNDGKIDLIPLSEAVLCEDCKVISSAKHANCPSCGGTAIWSLVRVTERVTQPEMDRIIEDVWQKS